MNPLSKSSLLACAAAAALVLAACGKKEQAAPPPPPAPAETPTMVATPIPAPAPAGVSVVGLELGNAIDAEQRVSATTKAFAPTDTIYLAVLTDGSAGSAVIAVKWTYQDGQTVKEDTVTIAPSGPARTVFNIAKPDGWPAGSYAVAVTLDGNPAGNLDFEVQ